MSQNMLLHICCGPCSIYPLQYLRGEGYAVTGYFYNPNIHPYREFKHRLDTLRDYARQAELTLMVDDRYTLDEFLTEALAAKDRRCFSCYLLRLREAAKVAREGGFDSFSTSLLVSPYQKHDWIRAAGEQAASEYGVDFYYADYREGWPEGVRISKELELYRQPYCGCIFSEKERYCKPRKG